MAASAIARHQRLDAGYFVGRLTGKANTDEVAAARKHLARARARLRSALKRKTEADARFRDMRAAGEITVLE